MSMLKDHKSIPAFHICHSRYFPTFPKLFMPNLLMFWVIFATLSCRSFCLGQDSQNDPRLRHGWISGEKFYSYSTTTTLPDSDKVNVTGVFKLAPIDTTAAIRERIRLMLASQGSGTGFVITQNGIILTCAHVVAGATDIVVEYKGKKHSARIIDVDFLNDVAIIKIEAATEQTISLSDKETADVGQEVYALGFPETEALGSELKINRGIIAGKKTQHGAPELMLDMKINPGNSGGPLVDSNGKVVGIISAIWTISNPIGVATPLSQITKLLRRNNIELKRTPSTAKIESADLYNQTKDAIVNIMIRSVSNDDVNALVAGGTFRFNYLNGKSTNEAIKHFPFTISPNVSVMAQAKDGRVLKDTIGVYNALSIPSNLRQFLIILPSKPKDSWEHSFCIPFHDYSVVNSSMQIPEYYGIVDAPGSPGNRGDKLQLRPIRLECKITSRLAESTNSTAKIHLSINYKSEVRPDTRTPYFIVTMQGEYVHDLLTQSPLSFHLKGTIRDHRTEKNLDIPIEIQIDSVSAKKAYEIESELAAGSVRSETVFRRGFEHTWEEPKASPKSELPRIPAIPQIISDKEMAIHIKHLRGGITEHQRDAAKSLASYRPSGKVGEVSAALVFALSNGDQYTAKYVLKALGIWGDDHGIQVLREHIKSEAWLRDDAIESLGKLRAIEAVDDLALVWFYKDSGRAFDALKGMGSDIEERLHKYLEETDPRIRRSVVKLLSEVATRKSETALQTAMKRETDDATRQAIDELLIQLRKNIKR